MSNEITLYDASGRPTAYIVPDNGSIYLWSGKPVAYLHNEHIYGFNGRHLGWFEGGLIWTHNGTRAGFTRDTVPVFAQFEPFKAFKQFQPFKAFKQLAPFKPFRSTAVAAVPLADFLGAGR